MAEDGFLNLFRGLPKPERRFETFGDAMERFTKRPSTGVTQGGSSRKGNPARVAARDANTQKGGPNR